MEDELRSTSSRVACAGAGKAVPISLPSLSEDDDRLAMEQRKAV